MSYSSIWVINNKTNGKEYYTYDNSFLFSPAIWNIIVEKYLNIKNGATDIVLNRNNIFNKTNKIMNESKNIVDRIAWEVSNQEMFFVKDKNIISSAIKDFLYKNKKYSEDFNNSVFERFNIISEDILSLSSKRYPYFIFKNTSCDDSVENIFGNKRKPIRLDSYNKKVIEIVKIQNQEIIDFISNLNLFSKI